MVHGMVDIAAGGACAGVGCGVDEVCWAAAISGITTARIARIVFVFMVASFPENRKRKHAHNVRKFSTTVVYHFALANGN